MYSASTVLQYVSLPPESVISIASASFSTTSVLVFFSSFRAAVFTPVMTMSISIFLPSSDDMSPAVSVTGPYGVSRFTGRVASFTSSKVVRQKRRPLIAFALMCRSGEISTRTRKGHDRVSSTDWGIVAFTGELGKSRCFLSPSRSMYVDVSPRAFTVRTAMS